MKIMIFLLALVVYTSASAQPQDSTLISRTEKKAVANKRSYFGLALGTSISTNGFGANISTALNKSFAVRLGYEAVNMTFNNAFTYNQDDRSFNVSPTWKSGGLSAILDFYLLKGFYLSGGVMQTNMNISCKIASQTPITVGSIEFKPDELGNVTFFIKPQEHIAPYTALGFGRNISRDHRFAINFEMGAYYMKSYIVDMNGTKLFEANNDPANQESLNNLNKTLKNINWNGVYPIIKLGLSYKFYGNTKPKTAVAGVNKSAPSIAMEY